jgi:hypothetical protein
VAPHAGPDGRGFENRFPHPELRQPDDAVGRIVHGLDEGTATRTAPAVKAGAQVGAGALFHFPNEAHVAVAGDDGLYALVLPAFLLIPSIHLVTLIFAQCKW